MTQKSIFFDEWRHCLQAHYKTFVREEYLHQQDRKQHARDSLEKVLHQVGFSNSELSDLFSQALRVEDAAPDFVPTVQAHPSECRCAVCSDAVLTKGHDEDGQPLPVEPITLADPEATGNMFPVLKRKSLFEEDVVVEPEPLAQEADEASKPKRKSKKTDDDAAEPKPRRQSMF